MESQDDVNCIFYFFVFLSIVQDNERESKPLMKIRTEQKTGVAGEKVIFQRVVAKMFMQEMNTEKKVTKVFFFL